jgi:hypothetical protein
VSLRDGGSTAKGGVVMAASEEFGNSGHLGAHSELTAAAWLLAQGYEVFRNVCAVGLVDIVAWKDGETLLLDVKAQSAPSPHVLTKAQRKAGVKVLSVLPDGSCVIARIADFTYSTDCAACGELFTTVVPNQRYWNSYCKSKAKTLRKQFDLPPTREPIYHGGLYDPGCRV